MSSEDDVLEVRQENEIHALKVYFYQIIIASFFFMNKN